MAYLSVSYSIAVFSFIVWIIKFCYHRVSGLVFSKRHPFWSSRIGTKSTKWQLFYLKFHLANFTWKLNKCRHTRSILLWLRIPNGFEIIQVLQVCLKSNRTRLSKLFLWPWPCHVSARPLTRRRFGPRRRYFIPVTASRDGRPCLLCWCACVLAYR